MSYKHNSTYLKLNSLFYSQPIQSRILSLTGPLIFTVAHTKHLGELLILLYYFHIFPQLLSFASSNYSFHMSAYLTPKFTTTFFINNTIFSYFNHFSISAFRVDFLNVNLIQSILCLKPFKIQLPVLKSKLLKLSHKAFHIIYPDYLFIFCHPLPQPFQPTKLLKIWGHRTKTLQIPSFKPAVPSSWNTLTLLPQFLTNLTETHPSDLSIDATYFTDTSLRPHVYIRCFSYGIATLYFQYIVTVLLLNLNFIRVEAPKETETMSSQFIAVSHMYHIIVLNK